MAQVIEIKPVNAAVTLQVNGMDCADCAAKTEKAVKSLPGIHAARVSFPQGRLEVEYDTLRSNTAAIIAKVRSLGYDAEEYRPERALAGTAGPITFAIGGLDCADCAAQLEKRIAQVPGVETARVNFTASTLVVRHHGDDQAILQAIHSMGYSGRIEEGQRRASGPTSFWKSNKYVFPTVVSLVMLVLGLVTSRMGVSAAIPTGFFLAGIILGGYLELKTGLAVFLSIRELDMNILMSIAVVGAIFLGEFEEAAVVVFLFSLGNALQGYTLDKTRNSIRALMDLTPSQALVRRGGIMMTLPVDKIIVDDLVIVRPGDKIAMDGEVVKGASAVNQAPITGESIPVEKGIGDEVFAGTINELGSMEIRVTKLAQDNTISRLIAMVEEAQGQRAPSQQFIDRFARYYTPAVIMAALLVATVPVLLLGQPFQKWFYQAMAMLLVACPCALVISTPVSIVAAIGSAARNGVLIKGGSYLEEVGALSVIAFDKTGTLTSGQPVVTDVVPRRSTQQEVLGIAAAIETLAGHPLGEAIIKQARRQQIPIPRADHFQAVLGQGARAEVAGRTYQIGNPRFFETLGFQLGALERQLAELQDQGKTVMLLGDDSEIMGLIAVADEIRANAPSAVQQLRRAGISKVIMLTGDNERTAQVISERAGADEFRAELLPEDKVGVMQELLAENYKVAMVGDGVNDAPAMAISTVGIAMGAAGTDVALETADIALMADDLTKLSYLIRLSRRTLGIIKQNIIFALAVKALILLLVVPGWLTLWLAVVGDMGSSLLVTLNSMRLLRSRHGS
ncbi:MAG: heavy metal translocating P-type ATPase [Syntrophomonas sp.]|nr:heavy metal translocating P-type ATPase [Syntrophomonas sp.]